MDLILIVMLACPTPDPPLPTSGHEPAKKQRQELLEKFRKEAEDYNVSVAKAPNEKLRLRPEPVLHWGNAARLGEDGAVFLWLRRGRPEMIASLFRVGNEQDIARVHELHSLAQSPLCAVFRGDLVWAPATAGMELKRCGGAADAAGSTALRLTQMRSLAREFTAHSVDPDSGRIELRLMPQPLYRYEPSGDDLVDGALFAFAHGTDPEVLLAIEARRGGQAVTWWYGLARFSDLELRVQHRGEDIWSVGLSRALRSDIRRHADYQKNIYVTFRAEPLLGE